MIYLLLILPLLFSIILYVNYSQRNKQTKKLQEIKNKWGKPIIIKRNFKLISQFHQNLNLAPEITLSDEITKDIDLEELFHFIDRTNSKPGQQYLYNRLKTTTNEPILLQELDVLAETFKEDEDLRVNLELELNKLNHTNAYYIQELFTTTYYALYASWLATYIKLAGLIWIVMLTITILQKNQFFFIITLGLTFVNFYIHYTNKSKISRYVHSIPQLHMLIQTAKKCAALIKDKSTIKDSLNELVPLKRNLSYINFQDESKNNVSDISTGVLELIKTLLLIEPAMFLISINRINQQKSNIQTIFNYIARIDLAISIMSLRTSLPYYSKPKFKNNSSELLIEEVFHPNIANCVPNSINAKTNQGILITGSNMSGKTTFIRSIIINALLSQTLFTSCTKSYAAPFMNLFTSIRISDNLEENKSYFQAEALSILNILNKSTEQKSSLIIIDEIFRGTNTIERIAAAKAILSYLTAQQNFVFVSTHDLELAELLGNEYCCYSFEEKVAETRLIFDYKIKPGILKNKNGIAILSFLGYPESVVHHANEISSALRAKYNI